jgi:energy-coupling factor transport system permease protein
MYRMLPVVIMGYYLVSTTTVSEFVASMERIHAPRQLVIPLSVMFRFFPTVAEEASSIGDAMKMRGIRFGINALEYRVVPLLMSTVKIGDELSAASLTRGLGNPVRRTNICSIGFHIQDIVFTAAAIICLIMFFYAKWSA